MPIARAKQIENETGKGKSNRMEEVDRETRERVWFEVWANIVVFGVFLRAGKWRMMANSGVKVRLSWWFLNAEWWSILEMIGEKKGKRKKKGPKETK